MDTNETTKIEKAKKAATFLTGLITGWGVPGTVAKTVAGAIIGAIAAIAAMLTSSCTVDATQTQADGSASSYRATVSLPLDAVLNAAAEAEKVKPAK